MAPSTAKRQTVTIGIPTAAEDMSGYGEFRESACRDTSNWNSLLRWHRRNRGPQWDYSTAMYHIDLGSAEYFGGVNVSEAEEKVEEPKAEPPPSPERVPATRQTRQQASASATPSTQPAALPPMPALSLDAQNTAQPQLQQALQIRPPLPPASQSQMQTQQAQLVQPGMQQQFNSAANMSPETRQQYEAMFLANRQRAASLQAQQQQQQQQQQFKPSSGQTSGPMPIDLQSRQQSHPAFSPPPGMQMQPQGQAIYPGHQQVQQYGAIQQQQQQQQAMRSAQPQQIDPRTMFQPPQQ